MCLGLEKQNYRSFLSSNLSYSDIEMIHQSRGQIVGGRQRLFSLNFLLIFPHLVSGLVLLHEAGQHPPVRITFHTNQVERGEAYSETTLSSSDVLGIS